MKKSLSQHATLGSYLRTCREKAGFSQKQVAKKIGYKAPQFISNLETGRAGVPPKRMRLLAKAVKADKKKIFNFLLATSTKKLMTDLKIKRI